jgi:RNA polymerase sigma-70 factor (sigma-E family)
VKEVAVTYDEFVHTRLAALSRYALMLAGDRHTAQDLLQETMVRAHLNWSRVARAESPDGYVRRMMLNQYLDWRRGSWLRRVLLRPEPVEPNVQRGDLADDAVDRDVVWAALATLPRQQRAALVLRYYEDLPDAAVADALGCTVGTARGYISRALGTLRTGAAAELRTGGTR